MRLDLEKVTFPGMCECGCTTFTRPAEKTDRHAGNVVGRPLRFVRGHSARKHDYGYDVTENGCWIFRGFKNRMGYGFVSNVPAHRVYYEHHVGPIPVKHDIDHLCRNPSCVNPEHLEAVTHRENMRRSPLVGRWPRKKAGWLDENQVCAIQLQAPAAAGDTWTRKSCDGCQMNRTMPRSHRFCGHCVSEVMRVSELAERREA